MRIYVLALNEVFDTGLTTLLDTFGTANDLAESAGTPSTRFDVTVVGVRSRVYTSHGLSGACTVGDTTCAPGCRACAGARGEDAWTHCELRLNGETSRTRKHSCVAGLAAARWWVLHAREHLSLLARRCSTAIVRRHHGGSPRSFVNGTRMSC